MTHQYMELKIEELEKRIKALEQQSCDNAINHKDTLKAMIEQLSAEATLYKVVKNMPPVNPQPKTGHWIFDEILDKHYYCSECKSMGVDYWDYCPYCGAKMVEPQESEE